ncbi:MAG TPA: endolytic transglycosylase MltG [Nitrospirales bacterium]|nr:endolytic transglycosylase MltG [Nitrospirales bacterium]
MRQILVFMGMLVLIGTVAAYGHRALDMPAQKAQIHHVVEIPEGASFKDVSNLLGEKGLILSPFWFRLLGKVQDAERKVKPGEYDLHTAMRPAEILNMLVTGKVIKYTVLVQEGFTARQIGKLLDEARIVKEADVARLVSDPLFIQSLGVDGPTLEGYLFPDTYYFPRRAKAEEVVKAMVAGYRQAYTPEMQARAASLGMTERQVMTLASIIEKETGQDEERPLISAVFHNRLKRRLPLQSDPTVIYGITNFSGNLTRADLTRRTPFNTYTSTGLPPGPIASPGSKSIIAALNPAPVDYIFFVSKNDGTHQFSTTLSEHNRAVGRYQKRTRPAVRKAA